MYFPHGYMVVSGSAGENDNGDGNGLSLLGNSDIPRASTVRLPNTFVSSFLSSLSSIFLYSFLSFSFLSQLCALGLSFVIFYV